MSDTRELIRRANTVKLSRPEVWRDVVRCADDDAIVLVDWYILADVPPHYPVPAMIGRVDYYYSKRYYDIIVTDCDERFDPRLFIEICDDELITDYPHDSPNYR